MYKIEKHIAGKRSSVCVFQNRTFVETKMTEIVGTLTGDLTIAGHMMINKNHEINDLDCHKEASTAWHELCFDLALVSVWCLDGRGEETV